MINWKHGDSYGQKVRTKIIKKFNKTFLLSVQEKRKDGMLGVVIGHHDSHGLCFDVRHEDGTIGSYEPEELEIIYRNGRHRK